MDTENTPQEPTRASVAMEAPAPVTPPAPEGAAAPGQAYVPAVPAVPAAAGAPTRKLSTFLKVSIALLIGLTLASISLVFIGDFAGKFERVFSTFVLFAVFTGLTALDTRRDSKSDWYAPVALIANAYILGLLLIVIWMTPYHSFTLGYDIFWKSLLVIAITRAVLGCCQLLLKLSDGRPSLLGGFSMSTSILAVLAGIMFTAPIAIETFKLTIPELYWRIAVAVLILTALGLAVSLLLRWFYGAEERDAARAARAAMQPAVYPAQSYPAPSYYGEAPAYPAPAYPAPAPAYPAPGAAYPAPPAPVSAYPTAPAGYETPAPEAQPASAAPAQVAAAPPAPAEPAAEAPVLLAWPTFANGQPIPAGPDGQPDFSVPGAPLPPQ